MIPGSLTSYELFFISHKKETAVKRNFGNSGFPVDCVPTLVAKVFLDFSFLLIFLRMRELRESREAEQIERYIFFRSLKNALWLNHWQPVKVFKSLMTDCLIFCSNFKEWKEPIQFKSPYYRKLTRIFEKLQGVKFLFFPIFWPASYFLLFFQEIPIFSYFFRV